MSEPTIAQQIILGRLTKEEHDLIVKCREKGMTYKEIQKEYGYCSHTITKHSKNNCDCYD